MPRSICTHSYLHNSFICSWIKRVCWYQHGTTRTQSSITIQSLDDFKKHVCIVDAAIHNLTSTLVKQTHSFYSRPASHQQLCRSYLYDDFFGGTFFFAEQSTDFQFFNDFYFETVKIIFFLPQNPILGTVPQKKSFLFAAPSYSYDRHNTGIF